MNLDSTFFVFLSLSVLFVIGIYLILNKSKSNTTLENNSNKEYQNLRIQAYERMALFLERIKSDALVSRVSNDVDSLAAYHALIINDVRSEFNHNLAQQVYLSHQLWEQIRACKDEVINCVSVAAKELPADSRAIELGKNFVVLGAETCDKTILNTLKLLKREFNQIN